jgi:hypothetical protein
LKLVMDAMRNVSAAPGQAPTSRERESGPKGLVVS